MRAVIICGGNVGKYILDYVRDDDYIICADSGYDRAMGYGIKPDIIIGDMDSIKGDYSSKNIEIYPAKKDFTDSELAIKHAISKGYTEILMFGMIGTRMDHTFSNLSLLFGYKDSNITIIDEHNIIYLVSGEITINASCGDIVSILPFSGDLIGVTAYGLEYPLLNSTIKFGTSLGVSNKMTEDACHIEIKEGTALVIRSKD